MPSFIRKLSLISGGSRATSAYLLCVETLDYLARRSDVAAHTVCIISNQRRRNAGIRSRERFLLSRSPHFWGPLLDFLGAIETISVRFEARARAHEDENRKNQRAAFNVTFARPCFYDGGSGEESFRYAFRDSPSVNLNV